MKKKIAILGSTGSIGKSLINILKEQQKKSVITLLSTNKNYKELLNQANYFNVKNLIISDKKTFKKCLNKKIFKNRNLYNNFDSLNLIFKKKNDYTMSAISGLEGLHPTLKIIRYSKKIAIANKESIICAWQIILKQLKKNKTIFIPVDSEHFSLWFGLNNNIKKNIEKIFITASGGPLNKLPLSKFKDVTISQALRHPNWKMGKKISIDSATLMNKVFEVIEAKNIFSVSYQKISILIHPSSYVHAIIKFNNGLIKIIAHDTDMKIPIFNTLFSDENKSLKSQNLNINKLNNLDLKNVNIKKFPLIKILKNLPEQNSLFETVIVSANDTLVELFLDKKIIFQNISKLLIKFIKLKEFEKFKKIRPSNIDEILTLRNYVSLKLKKKVYDFDYL